MSNNIPPPGERFKRTLLSLAHIMEIEMSRARAKGIDTVDKKLVDFGIELIKLSSGDIIIGGFITRSFKENSNGTWNNFWDKILEKDEIFFMEEKNSSLLFGELSSSVVDGFTKLIREKHVSDKLMVSVWQHLHAMVKISIYFVHFERKPEKYSSDGAFGFRYTNKKVREHINLEEEAEKWNVDLMKAK